MFFACTQQVLASQAVVEQLMENRYLALQRLMAFMVSHVISVGHDRWVDGQMEPLNPRTTPIS